MESLSFPFRRRRIGFADNVAVVAISKQPEDIEAINTIITWLEMVGLNLAKRTTEVVSPTDLKKEHD